MPQLKPINECCEQNPVTTGFAHSKGEPDVSLTMTSISVRFAPISHVELVIKRLVKKSNEKSTVNLRAPLTAAQPSTTTWREL